MSPERSAVFITNTAGLYVVCTACLAVLLGYPVPDSTQSDVGPELLKAVCLASLARATVWIAAPDLEHADEVITDVAVRSTIAFATAAAMTIVFAAWFAGPLKYAPVFFKVCVLVDGIVSTCCNWMHRPLEEEENEGG